MAARKPHSGAAVEPLGDRRRAAAERALVGALLIDPEAFARVSDKITERHLVESRHRAIFAAARSLHDRGEVIDAQTVAAELERQGRLAAAGLGYIADLVEERGSAANVESYARVVAGNHDYQELRVCAIAEFLSLELPPREDLLGPWLPKQGLAMIHARRGAGKTHFAFYVAWAIVSGSSFLKWRAPIPAGVLYIDGEMPAVALQERLARMAIAAEAQPAAPFDLITPDLQAAGMPDLASIEGQAAIDACVRDDHALIVVDNLSSMCRAGKENEAESWLTVQTWALRHRAKGRSILFVHHSGKTGLQRGTSRREDVLDSVIQLRQPANYEIGDGARFEVSFEKARGITGSDVEPFEAQLGEDDQGRPCWAIKSAGRSDQIIAMAQDGMKPAEIAQELGVNRSTVYRQIKTAVEDGKLSENVVLFRPKK